MSSTKSSDDSQERKLTIMIIVIVGVFFLCNITGYSLSEALILIETFLHQYDNRFFVQSLVSYKKTTKLYYRTGGQCITQF